MQFGKLRARKTRAARPGKQNGDIAPAGDRVFRGQRQRPLDDGFRRRPITPLVMHPSGKPQRDHRRQWMLQFLGKPQRVGEGIHRSAVITEQPAVLRKVPAAAGAGVVAAIEKRLPRVAFPVVERDPAFHMLDRSRRASAAR
jgi:hypothetical protein